LGSDAEFLLDDSDDASSSDSEPPRAPVAESITQRDSGCGQGACWTGAAFIPSSSPAEQEPPPDLPPIEAYMNTCQNTKSFPELNRAFTAPFSLGQAILTEVSPLPDLDLPISKTEQAHLMLAYLRGAGTWCETTDSDKHFTVKSIHSMVESKAFFAAALSLSSRQLDAIKGRHRQTALELYQYTIRLLIQEDPAEADTSILATCTLLCVYEMMASSVEDWRRHLKGCAGLLKSRNWSGSSRGIVKSCFWAFARIDIWAAFTIGQMTLIPTECWVEHDSIPSVLDIGDVDDYCNLAILIFAKIVNSLVSNPVSPKSQPRILTERLWKDLSQWWKFRPREVCPLMRADATGTNSPFPVTIFSRSSSICGNTFYHAGSILLLETGLVKADLMGQDTLTLCRLQFDALWHARELGGISMSNDSHANWVNHLQPLYIAGRAFANSSHRGRHWGRDGSLSDTYECSDHVVEDFASEKLALLRHLARIERETGWKTSERSAELRNLWGFA
ncbi:alkaline phosphatase family protein, partial [Colletotrichum tofieldiae]